MIDMVHARWPKVGLKKGGEPQDPAYSVWKKDLLEWPLEKVAPIIRAFYNGEIEIPGKSKTLYWNVLLPVLKRGLGAQRATQTEFENGDVVEVEGVVGIVSRNDADNYVALLIPKRVDGQIFWLSGTSRIGDAHKLEDADAWEWAREWRDDSYSAPMGMPVWLDRFTDE
jgi:hypothetical protein